MPEEIGALNTPAAPPVADTTALPAPAPDLGSQSASEASASPSQPVSEAAGSAEGVTSTEAANGDPAGLTAEADGREKFIPRERFEQVNTRAKELEASQQEWRETASLGLQSLDQYRAVVAEAQQYGYSDVRAYIIAVQEQRQLQADIATMDERFDISDEVKQELIAAKTQHLQNQQQIQQSQRINQDMLRRTVETTLTEAKATIGAELPPEMESMLRQSSPEVIASAAKSIRSLMEKYGDNRVAQYAAAKDKTGLVPAPEGRGGDPPAPTRPSGGKDFRNTSFSQLMGFSRSQ